MDIQQVQAALICKALSSASALAWADYSPGFPALGGGLNQDRTVHETYPGSNSRDWSQPGIKVEDD